MYEQGTSAKAYTEAFKAISEYVYRGEGKISTMGRIGADHGNSIDVDRASLIYDELVRYKRAAEARRIKGAPKDVVGSVRGRGLKQVDAEARIFLEEFAKSFKVDINVVDDTGDGSLGSTNPLSRRITLSVKSANELSTLLHESGHLMKAWDPDTFYAIQDAVCDWFAKYNNTTLENLIENRQAEYTEKEGKPCSYQEAKDEVTCNAIEAIQTAENFAEEFTQTMAELQYPKAQAEEKLTALQKFLRKIKLALNNILDRIRNKRSGDLMITAEGKVISKDIAMVNDLLKKVRQGLTNVRTNYDAYVAGAEVKGNNDGNVKKMYGKDATQKTFDSESTTEFGFGKYSAHTKENWNTSKRIVICETKADWKNFISKALSDNQYHKKAYFGYITSDLAQRIFASTNVDVTNYNCSISAYEIKKIRKDHGNEAKEALRGQRAITEKDYLLIPEIIFNADNITLSDKKYEDKPVLNFVKQNSPYERTTVTAVVSDKHMDLFVQTEFINIKKGNLSSPIGVQAPINTPEATRGTVSNNIITKPNSIVNTNFPTDSDNEHKQHLSSEADEQAKADELEALREENKALKAMDKRRWQMIDYLQKQLDQWKRGGKKLDYRGIEKLARSLIKEYGAKVDVKAYAKELTGFFNYMTNNPKPSAYVIRKRYTELAEKLIHNVEAVNPEVQEQLNNIRHIIRDGVALNVNQRGDVLHRFETMAKYREKVGGSVRITNKGIPLDDAWNELSALYPDLFPDNFARCLIGGKCSPGLFSFRKAALLPPCSIPLAKISSIHKKHPNGCFCVWWRRGESNPCPKTYSSRFLRV